eukprot:CAMPEP_0197904482 /NCGR_PEP_ID=MMETSP1439-20131203/58186_1 /TAXON_ID=66791 /ORGANISM="Gonyaulax spinifera, Strain CCMP409" /LENGTH=50 /DNA_ID=CAMNT_0043525681 /DNA_START=60 /DNA_END=208 /DNA_ORIENTATION=+
MQPPPMAGTSAPSSGVLARLGPAWAAETNSGTPAPNGTADEEYWAQLNAG